MACGIAEWDRRVVWPHVLAERDPGGHLALVHGEVRVHLRTRRVASDVDAIRDTEPLVRPKPAVLEADSNGVEAEVFQRRRTTDGQEDLVALNGRAIGQIDGVSIVGAGPGPDARGVKPCTDVDAVMPKGRVERRRASRMVIGIDPIVRRDEHCRDTIASEDLRHLDSGRSGADDDQAPG